MNREPLGKQWKILAAGFALGLAACGGPEPQAEEPEKREPFFQQTSPDTVGHAASDNAEHLKLRPRFKSHVRADGSIQGAQAIFDYPGATTREVDKMEHCGNNTDKILLTFDDYGSPQHIAKITKVLNANHVGAVFFPNTEPGKVSQETIDKLRKQGYYVGNHTATHPYLVPMSDKRMARAIKSGGKSTLFRPPYGGTFTGRDGKVYFDGDVKRVTESPNVRKRLCFWTIDTKDWTGISADEIQKRVWKKLAKGSVILEHQNEAYNTLEALPGLIKGIRKRGYELCEPSPVPTTTQIPASLHC